MGFVKTEAELDKYYALKVREFPDAPALAVIAKMLRSLYLHREIREKGGGG